MTKPLDTPVLVARDLILEACRHRINLTLTETVCRDLANNAATALIPLLEDLQRGSVAAGTIVSDEPPPVRDPRDVVGPCGHYGCSGENCDNEPPF